MAHRRLDLSAPAPGHRHAAALLRPPGAGHLGGPRLADLVGPDADAYVYFNNDPAGCAVRDARVFALAAARAGLRPTRVPAASEVRVGY